MKFKKTFAALLTVSLFFSTVAFALEDEMSAEYSYVDKMFGYAAELYVDDTLTKEEILKKALDKYLEENPDAVIDILKAGFSGIDDYTEFYTGEEYKQYVNDINHTFYGIGVIIQKEGDYVQIVRLLEDGSAIAAGLQEGDKLSRVNGIDMKGKTIDEVQQNVVGELNTTVEITVLRGGSEYTYELVRKPVSETTVDYLMFENNIAYVSILNFASSTSEEFANMLVELDAKGVTNIILDLRNNPGGYLVSAVEIAQMTVPKGIIVQTMFRQSENNLTYYSELENPKYKFAILVNENTASAAEVLTGAMQDSGVGTVIGKTTFGKAVIQDMFNMRDGNAFKITSGRYLTRNGREINLKGLDPDIEVFNGTEPIDVTKYDEIDFSIESRYGETCDNISVIKERLRIIGYGVSTLDDNFDQELEAVVLDFQISKGLKPTGALDRITMVQIENAFAQAEVLVDYQLYEAYEYFGGTVEGLQKVLNSSDD